METNNGLYTDYWTDPFLASQRPARGLKGKGFRLLGFRV